MSTKEKEVVFPAGLHPFVGKKIGANFIATTKAADGKEERHARKVTQEEFTKIKSKIDLYNKKPSEARKAEIVKLMAPAATAKKAAVEKTEVATKAIEKKIKKEEKKDTSKTLLQQLDEELSTHPEGVAVFQKILNKYKITEKDAPKAQETKRPTRKEVYRNGRTSYIYVDSAGFEVKEDGSPLI